MGNTVFLSEATFKSIFLNGATPLHSASWNPLRSSTGRRVASPRSVDPGSLDYVLLGGTFHVRIVPGTISAAVSFEISERDTSELRCRTMLGIVRFVHNVTNYVGNRGDLCFVCTTEMRFCFGRRSVL